MTETETSLSHFSISLLSWTPRQLGLPSVASSLKF